MSGSLLLHSGRRSRVHSRYDEMARSHAKVSNGHQRMIPGFGACRLSLLAVTKLLILPLASAVPMHLWERDVLMNSKSEDGKSPDDPNLYAYLGIAVALVLLGGAFAGLTIALMGQDETYLQVIATSGEGSEKRHAKKVLGLLMKGKHWVLVTLLLSNVITNETLPIVLDRSLGGGWPAVLTSTVLIVIFGEIVPQSVCVRYGLSIGAFMAPFVLMLMWIMFPVAWPTAKLLDYLLGEDHGTMYKKAGLKTLVQLHKTLGTTPGERLMQDEVTIINSVLDLKEKSVGDIMTPMGDVFTMSADTVLDENMMDLILSQGYSRIPVFAPDDRLNFIGMLLVKILITYDPEDCLRVRDFALATLPETSPYTSCLDIINFFQEGKSHMVLVSDFPGQPHGALGVVTLEDVIEELIGEEIIDESDVFVDIHKAIRRPGPAPKTRFRQQEANESMVEESDHEGKAHDERVPLLENGEATESAPRKVSLVNSKAATLLAGRKSSNASDSTRDTLKPIVNLNKPNDLRQHLKHLGPSNAASRPRATRFSSVKIKPGVGTIPEGQVADQRNVQTASKDETSVKSPGSPVISIPPPRTESSGLLSTAGRVASDGVAAIANYGTTNTVASPPEDVNGTMSASEASKAAEQNVDTTAGKADLESSAGDNSYKNQAPKLVIRPEGTIDEDSVTDTKWGAQTQARDARLARRMARSGSITETMVDSGGMKKIVLETTSSSEELDISRSASAPPTLDEESTENEADNDLLNPNSASGKSKMKKKKRSERKK